MTKIMGGIDCYYKGGVLAFTVKIQTFSKFISSVIYSQQRFFTGFVRNKNVALRKQITAADYETSWPCHGCVRRRRLRVVQRTCEWINRTSTSAGTATMLAVVLF